MEYLFILGRIILGGFFLKNGINHLKNSKGLAGYAESKGVPAPKLSVLVTGIMLLLGGLGILLGVYVEFAVLLLVLFLLGTIAKMHAYWTVEDPMAKMTENVNFYKNLALIGALLMLLSIPAPWAMSLGL
ncbi:DoxX family protein [Candidatus Nomurabacteria bacterium RIFCSPHIGHO2_02_FULL_41_18]|uniref:DoxX family protein n=1 Tax=Candidatus Nomurabacteria bacterium RIFCSPHIGHO2_02_FULL_41_18 TaxID=1801754 RepID=A0A1F6W626_9BACT|nr:MAG: DoxX family protein [Candidatus Nomurabacteria bacterium RIFCSPHIGHO2_01_FULL_41_71]OGI77216.1 MAG: DoxX family protein [Candidatus Nomurabacteria bacterium RIFCSPHIGHO2_02_FULL_41_18]OGI89391.1 MAG: DoxX family protein [Candidatus Nomurabacteria bacterium RIFCSPLOWO2_01_FULL_41_52b]